ncbi:MAG: MEDS domain-containing protein [Chitinispirillaceae bacterium]|nr:MEDS domain-containing protein [Chitinispirillaceae bacterium]
MRTEGTMTDLGFASDELPIGTHMCLIYTSEDERRDTLLKFLLSGLRRDERSACFSDKITEAELRFFFKENNILYDERKESGQITLSSPGEVYFKGGFFDPDRIIETLRKFYLDARDAGLPATRIIGEMVPEIKTTPGGERLLEYESRITILVRTHPVTAICQYNENNFDGKTIMEILKVHPRMIVNGNVIQNPFFIEPEEYLKGLNC